MNTQPKQGGIKLPCRVIDHEPSRLKSVVDADGETVSFGQEPERAQAIAHALNSQEELLSAAGEVVGEIESGRELSLIAFGQLRAALAKAKGEKI